MTAREPNCLTSHRVHTSKFVTACCCPMPLLLLLWRRLCRHWCCHHPDSFRPYQFNHHAPAGQLRPLLIRCRSGRLQFILNFWDNSLHTGYCAGECHRRLAPQRFSLVASNAGLQTPPAADTCASESPQSWHLAAALQGADEFRKLHESSHTTHAVCPGIACAPSGVLCPFACCRHAQRAPDPSVSFHLIASRFQQI